MVFFFSTNQQGGGRLSPITRARVQQEDEGRKATFADVAGVDEAREIVRNSFELEYYEPNPSSASAWDDAYGRFEQILG